MIQINDMARHAMTVQGVVKEAADRAISSGWYILGAECRTFEMEFAGYCGVGHCVGVANGTDALEIGLRALGIGPGHRVATVANAGFYATTALRAVGAEPVFVDIDPVDRVMSAAALSSVLKAGPVHCVVVTHLYGLLQNMDPICSLAGSHGIPIIEDCAQAHGAKRDGRRAGSFGQLGTFSFYPTKNLGAIGDGGAVVTNDPAISERVKLLRQYGWETKYRVVAAGGRNSRLDEIQAAVLRSKLPFLDGWNARRREIAARYSRTIQHPRVRTPSTKGEDYVAHLYVIDCDDRDRLRQHLGEVGIASDVHYPTPDHKQPLLAGREWPPLPVTEESARRILTLPCFPELTDSEVDSIAERVNSW